MKLWQIDKRELLDCKRTLDKMPQSKYEEDDFQLLSRGMNIGDLPSVVEMIEVDLTYAYTR